MSASQEAKAKRAELRKDLGRAGRAELLRMLEDAWRELDEIDDAVEMLSDRVCFSCLTIEHSTHEHEALALRSQQLAPPPTIGGEGQTAAVQDGDALPAQAERGSSHDVDAPSGADGEDSALDQATLDAIFGDDAS